MERAIPRPRAFTWANRKLALALLAIAAAVSLIYLSQTSDVASTSYDIADLQAQVQALEMQNEQLQLQVAQLESLDRVDREASTRLHMGPPEREIYVTAQAVPLPTPAAAATPTAAAAGERLAALASRILAVMRTPASVPTGP